MGIYTENVIDLIRWIHTDVSETVIVSMTEIELRKLHFLGQSSN